MIKKLYTLASISLLSFALFGLSSCVNEGTSVTLIGVASPVDCAAGESAVTTSMGFLEEGYTEFAVDLNIINNLTESSAWSSSSSSSSSGSTFEPPLPSMNTLYLEKLVVVCKKIDGNEEACNGKDDIKATLHDSPIRSGGTMLKGASIPLETWGSFNTLEFEMYVVYHDSGKFSDDSNSIGFEIRRLSGDQSSYSKIKEDNKCKTLLPATNCAHMGQGGYDNDKLWTCEEEDDKEEDKDKDKEKENGGDEEPEEWI